MTDDSTNTGGFWHSGSAHSHFWFFEFSGNTTKNIDIVLPDNPFFQFDIYKLLYNFIFLISLKCTQLWSYYTFKSRLQTHVLLSLFTSVLSAWWWQSVYKQKLCFRNQLFLFWLHKPSQKICGSLWSSIFVWTPTCWCWERLAAERLIYDFLLSTLGSCCRMLLKDHLHWSRPI